MSWITPVIDWDTNDGIMDSDFNRIEGDVKYLYDQLDAGETVDGVFNTTVSGYVWPPSIAIHYRITHYDSSYNLAQLWFPSFSGIANANTMALVDPLPSILRQSVSGYNFYNCIVYQSAAGKYAIGSLRIYHPSGDVDWVGSTYDATEVYLDTGTSWHNSGTRTFGATLIQYLIPKA